MKDAIKLLEEIRDWDINTFHEYGRLRLPQNIRKDMVETIKGKGNLIIPEGELDIKMPKVKPPKIDLTKLPHCHLHLIPAQDCLLCAAVYNRNSVNLSWQKEKPDYACVFLTRYNGVPVEFNLWKFVWELGEPPETAEDQEAKYYYLAWTDKDGDEWDDIDECTYDEYLVLEKLPTEEEVHQQFINSMKIKYSDHC
ncbi:MAG: hypothetical protein WC139_07090 [Candidatus Kapaibacterium sp.]